MTALEVFLIIIGIICICISFFVSRNTMQEGAENSAAGAYPGAEVWTEKDEQIVRQRLEEILQEEQTQYVDEAKELMGSLCNEKIMAIDEFSSQILEKISSNHQEVVFMYNMLNEKQKELKSVIAEKPKVTAPAEEEKPAPVVPKEPKRESAPVKEPVKKAAVSQTQMKVKQQPAFSGLAAQTENLGAPTGLSQVKKSASHKSRSIGTGTAEKPNTVKKVQTVPKVENTAGGQTETEIPGNVNLQIQKMHKEGKSVLEISKALDIGQGEVKLVIALYGGRKG